MGVLRRMAAGSAVAMSLVALSGCGGSGETAHPGAIPLVSTSDLPAAQPGEVHLFGINDLHGNLEPPQASNGQVGEYTAGGAAYLATHLQRLRAAYPNSAVVSAGDNIGASPLVSSLFHDEPTIGYLNRIGVAASAVGNHELDHGVVELGRLRAGGCALDGCSPGEPFTGARFDFLAANLTDSRGEPPAGVRPWTMLTIGGHKIGVVGVVTPDTVNLVFPEGIRGYTFGEEAEAINKYVPAMKQAGAETVVALVHDGGSQGTPAKTTDYNGCADISPDVPALAAHTDPDVRVLLTAHSHQAYNCEFDGKVVTQAASYGRLITDVTLRFDRGKVSAHAVNRVVTRDVAADPAVNESIGFFSGQAAPRAQRVVGTATAPLTRSDRGGGESPLGAVIADAMLDVTHDSAQAVAAFMNPGGVRADIGPGPISYGSIYETQPFGNQVVTVTLTGRQILDLLEQQWDNKSKPAVLSVAGISYSYDDKAAPGHKVIADSVRIGDRPLNPVATYRVTTNNFLASGGDGFAVFTRGTDTTVGPTDLDALETYLRDRGAVGPPEERVQRR
ncbi:bifunctional metallophosphatase/5'-nucleotidase [Nocardia africana]|uniref:Endonuclease YhcR n=1 Tax=Nocardia africana TaxID=134964 RepID=A0A378WNM3_9NOCA|nr:bifunctional UDP-sugar hydrolase/5'-nucleotidase [Nocardia africana]MCC3314868.1 bifunctional metallophosphatase/5'-nucleotidase [Nocardia africana]SUA42848.1 Endonuclease YhcR precursor [Nocardia africana]